MLLVIKLLLFILLVVDKLNYLSVDSRSNLFNAKYEVDSLCQGWLLGMPAFGGKWQFKFKGSNNQGGYVKFFFTFMQLVNS
jgi:hypothetical protein